jgi:hypothetical protein
VVLEVLYERGPCLGVGEILAALLGLEVVLAQNFLLAASSHI